MVGSQELLNDVKIGLILLLAGGITELVTTFLQSWMIHRGCCDMVNRLRKEFLAAVLRQDVVWFGENNSGAITSLLKTNIQKIEDGLGEKLGMLLRGFSMFIAHRLSTLKDVNRIYVLDNGVVVEEGTHDGLIEKRGIYAGLAKAQEINQAGQVNNEEFGISSQRSLGKQKSFHFLQHFQPIKTLQFRSFLD